MKGSEEPAARRSALSSDKHCTAHHLTAALFAALLPAMCRSSGTAVSALVTAGASFQSPALCRLDKYCNGTSRNHVSFFVRNHLKDTFCSNLRLLAGLWLAQRFWKRFAKRIGKRWPGQAGRKAGSARIVCLDVPCAVWPSTSVSCPIAAKGTTKSMARAASRL